jgi:hypothetical protein
MRVAGTLQTVEDIAQLFAADGVDANVRGQQSGAGSIQRRPEPSYICLIALLTSGQMKVNSLILTLGALTPSESPPAFC